MATLPLTVRERADLERIARTTRDADQLRHAQALLALADGRRAAEVARSMRMGRSTLYEWVGRFVATRKAGLDAATRRRPIPGRGRGLRDRAAARVAELLGRPPGDFGYRHTVWTAALLAEQLRREGVQAGDSTVRRAVHQAGYRWKRPRYVLARRSPTWRQAKGGSVAGSPGGRARWSCPATRRS